MEKEHFHLFEKKDKDKNIIHYDVCILGGGPAGLTSAIYSSRYGLHTALIAKEIGGMANYAEKIENYPGFEGNGMQLMQKFYEQAKKFKTEFLISEVTNIERDSTGFVIEISTNKVIHTKTIIISLGTEKRKLNIPGEDKFLGKGVSYCATCDANFFRNKRVAVIGGGDSAAKATLILSNIANKVYLLYMGDKLKFQDSEIKKIKSAKNIEIILNAEPKEIKGTNKVEELVYNNKNIRLDGIFVEIGSIPTTIITKNLAIKTDDRGYLIVNENMETSQKGIFAAGDAIKSKLKQVVVAASQGAIAAKSAFDYIKS